MQPLRLAVLPDFPEERWPSMDLVAEMLIRSLQDGHSNDVAVSRLCPAFRAVASHIPLVGRSNTARNVDRLVNRFLHYPRFARGRQDDFDHFHVCDHSYAQLVHDLPADRTGVFCHDLDTFRCLIDPSRDRRPKWFRMLAARTLAGFQKARLVFFASQAVRSEILKYGLIDDSRLVQAPLGVATEYSAQSRAPVRLPDEIASAIGSRDFVLHVGSCIPRKRIEVLLDVFRRLRTELPGRTVALVQVGGEWTRDQRRQIDASRLSDHVMQWSRQSRSTLAELYRRARVVLLTSDAEGFGMPVIEALACGATVVASDLPSVREAGGSAARYCPVGDAVAFVEAARNAIGDGSNTMSDIEARRRQAAQFSWPMHADTIVRAYRSIGQARVQQRVQP